MWTVRRRARPAGWDTQGMAIATRVFEMRVLAPSADQCAECASRLCAQVSGIEGVELAQCDHVSATMRVRFDPTLVTPEVIEAEARAAGLRIAQSIAHAAYRLHGLDCPDCARGLEASIVRLDGIVSANVNFASATLLVEHRPGEDPTGGLREMLGEMGYGADRLEPGGKTEPAGSGAGGSKRMRADLLTAVSGSATAVGWALASAGAADASVAAYVVAIATGGALTARRSIASLRARVTDMNVLMSIAVLGAVAIGEWAEAAMVVFLFALGGALESRSLERTRRSIRDLLDLAPSLARVRRGESIVEVAPDEVRVGEVVLVRPGERVPLDGVVTDGVSAVDASAVTGESVPETRSPGDPVFAGSLNQGGVLEVRVSATGTDSTLSRIVSLVEEAQASRAPVQSTVDRFARWYTPSVIVLAASVATLPPVLGPLLGFDAGPWGEWFYRALVVLVVSCPCALVVSTPVAVVSGITRATRDGVLVKGGAFLEAAADVRAVAFDKTGTLTYGRPEVADVVGLRGASAQEVLRIAAALAGGSTHPLSRAVARAAEGVEGPMAVDVIEEAGRGLMGLVDGVPFALGSAAFMRDLGCLDEDAEMEVERLEGDGHTVVVVARTGPEGRGREAVGVIGVSDEVRIEAVAATAALKRGGIRHLVMLTGDNERAASAVADRAGMTGYKARLLPGDKLDAVRELKRRHGVVAMVGDGVNDAPALAAADLGIAMGAAASHTALEAASVAVLSDDLRSLSSLFDLGRRTLANVRQNVAFSIVTKAAVLAAALAGYAPLWLAVFADTGVTLLVILNGLRLLRVRPLPR